MAGEVEKLSGKLGIDTTDFKTAIRAADRELRVLESGFKASAAALGDWTRDATGLESRVKSLTSQIDIQKSKVEALRAEHLRLVDANGETSRAAQEAEIKLNKETETLNKMSGQLNTTDAALAELKSGEEEAGTAANEMGNQVEESGSKMETFKSVLGGAGVVFSGMVTGMLAVGAAAIAAVGAIGALVFSTTEAASEINDLSVKTGISTTKLQEFDFIGNQVGVGLETITGANARLIRSMSTSQDQAQTYAQKLADAEAAGRDIDNIELGDSARAFETLGVSVTDAQGMLRDNQAVFAETLDALNKIENPAQRDALAMSLFGKSAQELNPIIKLGSEGMAEMAEQAHKMGAVMSEEDNAAFDDFGDKLSALQDGLKGTVGTLVVSFLPTFQGVLDQAGGYLETFNNIVTGADGDFGKLAEGLTGLVQQIATDIAAQAPQMLQAGLSIVKSILDAIIAALPSMLTAGIEIIKTLITFITEALPTLIDAGIEIILTLVDAIIQNLPMLIDAALQAVITLATGIAAALPTLIPSIIEILLMIVNTLLENLPLLVDAAILLITGLVEGLVAAGPMIQELVGPEMSLHILGAILSVIPAILVGAAQLMISLAQGLINLIPSKVLDFSTKFIESMLFQGVMWSIKAVQMGKDFVSGIIDGVILAKEWLIETVRNMAFDMIENIKSALLMQSPSRKGMDIGRNFGLSIPLGMQEAMGDIERQFTAMTGRLSMAAAGGLSPQSGNVNSSVRNDNFDFYGPVIFQGETPAESLGASIKMKRF